MFDHIKDRHDIGMIHSARGQGLALKEALRLARSRQGPQNHLQGDSLAGAFIGTGPHRSHSTLPNEVVDPVLPTHDLARLQDRLSRVLGHRYSHVG